MKTLRNALTALLTALLIMGTLPLRRWLRTTQPVRPCNSKTANSKF